MVLGYTALGYITLEYIALSSYNIALDSLTCKVCKARYVALGYAG